MGLHGMSTTFYDSKAISARCSRTDWKFRQNAKYDEISGRKTKVIYLCSAEGKRLADGCSLHHLPAFVLLFLLLRWEHGAYPCRPLLRKGIIAASGYLAQMWAQAPVCICPLWRAWHNTLDFVTKVVCHETPARFLWILPAATGGKRFFAHCRAATP